MPIQTKPMLKAIRGKPRASARQRRFINANLNQLAALPALSKVKTMFKLTIKLQLSYKQLVQVIGFLFMLFFG